MWRTRATRDHSDAEIGAIQRRSDYRVRALRSSRIGQLRDVRRDSPRLIFCEHGGRSPAGLLNRSCVIFMRLSAIVKCRGHMVFTYGYSTEQTELDARRSTKPGTKCQSWASEYRLK